ncbi:tetracycline-efflux transporter-like protein [Plenodomus tracheiphilus IPT5]|uniref:Tetracycline-efflux transporter-like protein n=1 Tax=Plenodomus tracheiphilus IPT5 TaxID=1408161 RepID=A0A6A7AXR9_9PLEO|nr:tetracycline-efflux transporter-like protein [Plenodomus tracheiphilus IPT5]
MSHTYQRVSEHENDDPPSYEATPKAWFNQPSVFWLLPVFLLFNLAMGATSMPRMNVITSLICRNILTKEMAAEPQDGAMLQPRHGGGMSGGSANMSAAAGNHSASAIIIGDYNPICAMKEVESATAMFNLWGNLIAGVIAAVATPFWGKLSDHFGRVKPLAAATTVMLFSEAVMVLVAKFPDALPLGWVYLTFVLEGMSGSFILIMALASSYAADCTRSEDRNVALGWFHGSMFFGMAAGPAFGGFLGMSGGKSNPMLVFYTGLAMRAFGILFLIMVPESLQLNIADRRPLRVQVLDYLREHSRGSWADKLKRVNPIRLLRILSPANAHVDKSTQRNVLALASINTILFGAMMGAMNVMMLYSEFRFGWGNKESGIFLSTVNVFRTLATVVVLPLVIMLSRRFSGSKRPSFKHAHTSNSKDDTVSHIDSLDIFLLRISILSDTIGYIGYAISPTGALFTLSGAIASLGAIGLATSEASMTKLLPASQTGELLGALGLLQALARIIAPTVAGLTYSWTTESMPQIVFWGIAFCFAVAGLLTAVLKAGKAGSHVKGEEDGEIMVPLQADKQYDGPE